jgi:hypothetical protein
MDRIHLPAIRGCVTLTSRWRNSGVVDGLAGSGMNSLSNTSPLDSIMVSGKRGLCLGRKVHIFTEYHSVCPLVGIGTLPPPLSLASVPFPRAQRGGGGHSRLRVRGWGSPCSDDWRKALALCLLCGLGAG